MNSLIQKIKRWKRALSYLISVIWFVIVSINVVYVYKGLSDNAPDPVGLLTSLLLNATVFLLLALFSARDTISYVFLSLLKRRKVKISRLQKRIIIALSIGSAVPTIMVALFSTYLFNFAIKNWFDNKITRILDQSITVGELYTSEHVLQLKETAISIASDLDKMYYELSHNPSLFSKVLNAQAEMRSLDEAIVFQKGTNTILAQSSLSFSLSFLTIPLQAMQRADKGEIVKLSSDRPKIRVLIRLRDYRDTYLVIGRLIDTKIIDHIDRTNGMAYEYFKVKNQIVNLQVKFSLVFIVIALLLLVMSIIAGNSFANRIVQPIISLAQAAEKVRGGDLSTQVSLENLRKDEVFALSSAFNSMVKQISRQQKELLIAQRALAWSDVARRVAHEIKNPLTPIQLSAEMLLKKFSNQVKDRESFEKYATNITRHVRDINMIVSEFVNFARLPAPNFGEHDIIALVKDTVDARKIINDKITYVFTSNISSMKFMCDTGQINQVMLNLLKNAEESFDAKITTPEIIVDAALQDELFTITVTDNGIGFDEDILGQAIKAYITTRKHGTGLGLAIVARIVQDHNGSVSLTNKPEGGASVTLIFDINGMFDKLG